MFIHYIHSLEGSYCLVIEISHTDYIVTVKQAYGHPQFKENTRERNVSCYPLVSALKHASLSVSLSSKLPTAERQGEVFRQKGKYRTRRSKKM